MLKYLIRRFMITIITVIGAMVVLFLLIQAIPGDPATVMLGPRATEEIIEAVRERMWLDRPVYIQLGRFLFNVLRGDLGIDVLNHMPVSQLVFKALPHTIVLAFSSIFIACLIGIPLGTYAAAYRNSFLDRITGILSISMITVPSFLAAILALLIFSVYLRWFPGMGAGERGNILSQLYHLVLPTLSLSLLWIGYIARIMRASVLEEMTEDYVRTVRAKGVAERKVVYKHVLRGAIIPVIAVVGIGFGNLLGGAVMVEIVFHRPGLGYLIYNAIQSRNYPVVQGGLIVAVFLYGLANFLADISYSFIDPRLRSE
ncbi:MAG: ABC transporter permease [Halanaerobiales bacterium]